MKNKLKKLVATMAAVAVALTTVVVTDVTPASAATDYDTLYTSGNDAENGAAGVEQKHSFTVSKAGDVYFYITTTEATGITVTLYNSSGAVVEDSNNPFYISSTDKVWTTDSYGNALNGDMWTLQPGDYSYGVTFDSDHPFYLDILQEKVSAKISDPTATVTAGFTKKLTVSGSKVTKWSTNKKAVATVNANGKVTGKKAGKATISAKCENGQTVKCVVTVKANKYTRTKPTLSDVTPGRWGQVAYNASFDSKGNLVIKTRILNNTNGRLTEIRNLKITVKNGNGKTVATYSASKQSISVPAYSTKDGVTYTISKSKVKKAVDLRNAKIECDGSGYGY